MPVNKEAKVSSTQPRRKSKVAWYSLLALQWILALCVPFYNTSEPLLAGMPFFYWYQLAMVLVCALLTAIVYWATERRF